jgi:hypothetical protein
MTIKIKNWSQFQHFKDRRPPWIKLYRDILDDYDISQLSDKSFRILINLWLLASEDKTGEGLLPHVDAIAHRLRCKKDSLLKVLEECGNFLIQDDINPISSRHQDDTPETEEEKRQRREEKEKRKNLFFDFYSTYPNKVSKQEAQKSWDKLVDKDLDLEMVISALREQIDKKAALRDAGEFVASWPHPSTWLNQVRWTDEIAEPGNHPTLPMEKLTAAEQLQMRNDEALRRAMEE